MEQNDGTAVKKKAKINVGGKLNFAPNLCLRLLNVYQLLTLASYYFILYTILAFTSSAVSLSLRRSIIAPANSMHVPIPRLVVN